MAPVVKVFMESNSEELRVTFPYAKELVEAIRCLPNRRWDPDQRAWLVPAADLGLLQEAFAHVPVYLAPQVRAITESARIPSELKPASAENRGDVPSEMTAETLQPRPMESKTGATLSVSQLNQTIGVSLRRTFCDEVWVAGRLVDYDKSKHRRTKYFELAEIEPESERILARIKAVLFLDQFRQVCGTLMRCRDPFELTDGLEVRLKVRVDFFETYGRLQLVVRDIDPAYTLGRAALRRDEIYRTLVGEGLAEKNLKLPMPLVPLRLGVMTSEGSDAYNDFLHELERSGFGFQVHICPVRVQGMELERSLLEALSLFERVDVNLLVIVRGGGSRADLGWFDNMAVARAIAQHPVKVICGIGHQQDQSVLDMIAHSEKTPTAAAAAIVSRVQAFLDALDSMWTSIQGAVRNRVAQSRRQLAMLSSAVMGSTLRLNREQRQLEVLQQALTAVINQKTESARVVARHQVQWLQRSAARHTEGATQQMHAFQQRIRPQRLQPQLRSQIRLLDEYRAQLQGRAATCVSRERKALTEAERLLALADPERVLSRGYAIVRGRSGSIVKSALTLRRGDILSVRFGDGTVDAAVTRKSSNGVAKSSSRADSARDSAAGPRDEQVRTPRQISLWGVDGEDDPENH